MYEKLKTDVVGIPKMFAASVTLGVGQFCTNPGLVFGIDEDELQQFILAVGDEIKSVAHSKMLHAGIVKAYTEKRTEALAQEEVTVVAESELPASEHWGAATIATVSAKAFLRNVLLHEEVFGPYSLVVRCNDINEMT